MTSIYAWDVIAANNANADSSIDWAEGMSPANVNDSARVMMGRIKELLTDLGGGIVATGTANVLAVTSQSAFTTLANGRIVSFRAIATNTQATTLNVNAIGAKPVLKATSSGIVPLTGNEIQNAGMYTVQYSAALNSGNGAWLLTNPTLAAVPPGVRVGYCGSNVPAGWLLCYGQAVSRTDYSDLFAAISTQFGTGDGSTTFNLPDYRGRTGAGKDDMGGTDATRLSAFFGSVARTLGGVLGAASHALTSAQNGPHTHPVTGTALNSGSHTHQNGVRSTSFGTDFTTLAITGASASTTVVQSDGTHTHTVTGTATTSGLGAAHDNAQPTIIENVIIKT